MDRKRELLVVIITAEEKEKEQKGVAKTTPPHTKKTQSVKVKVTRSCLTLWPHGLYSPWNSPGQNTGVSNLSLLQGIFPAQGSNPGLPHCRQILYQLSHSKQGIDNWKITIWRDGCLWPRVNWKFPSVYTIHDLWKKREHSLKSLKSYL